MGTAIGDMLPLAATIALFPIPILAVILLLFSPRGRGNVTAYTIGWVAGLTVIVTVAALLTTGVYENEDADDYHTIDWVRIAIGVGLLLYAAKKWLGRPKGPDVEMPGWMTAINNFTPIKALGIGLLLTALNPKNIALAGAAGTAVGQPDLSTAESVAVGLLFLLLSTLGILIPVLYYALGGTRARGHLESARGWLVANNAVVITVLMALIGVVLISEGIRGY